MEKTQRNWTSIVFDIAKAIALVLIVGLLGYKLLIVDMPITLDLPSILALLLALFSIYLSSMFYFKAAETSNSFYDNTYKFTKDIAELLVRIESGFGERLRHLDESYSRMEDRFTRNIKPEEIEKTQEEAQKSKEDLEKKLKERDDIVQELMSRAKLQGAERDSMMRRLETTESQLSEARQQLSAYQDELMRVKAPSQTMGISSIRQRQRIENLIKHDVLPRMDPSFIARAPSTLIGWRWKEVADYYPPNFISDLREVGIADSDGSLTPVGIRVFRSAAHSLLEPSEPKEE